MPTQSLSAAEVAHLAHAALVEVPSASPLLLLVRADHDGITFLAPPPQHVAGLDLLDQALGLVAPEGCEAVAMAAAGRAWPAQGATLDVVVAHALLRSGSAATYLTDDAGCPLLLDEDGVGLVPDLCRRVLGMPTPPPEEETGAYLSRLWLDRLLGAAVDRPGTLTRDEALGLHPTEQAATFGLGLSWMQVALATSEFAAAAPWAVLRRRFAEAGEDRAADAARWFDDGSFSRWMLARLPAADEALATLAEVVPAPVVREVRAALDLAADLSSAHEVDDDLDDDDAWWLDEDDGPSTPHPECG